MNNRPQSIGPYEVLEVVGRGATATVYEARHRKTGEIVALKVGLGFMGLEPGALERFHREFTAIRDLNHPGLVRALGFAEENEVPYVVMEFVAGKNLEETLRLHGPMTPADTLRLFLQVAEGLRYLHANHILHRDIKPSNIFLNADQQAKLGDFGLLKILTDEAGLTRSRQGLGTADYGAPEQFEDAKHVDCRCDLYSLAATLYFALTGKFAFGNGGHLQIMHRKLLNQFVPLRLVLPSLDPALDELVNRCLHPDPKQRPGACDEFIDVLRNCKANFAATHHDIAISTAKPRTGKERRATVRFAVDLTATFVPFHQNMRGRWQATVLDVSATGVRLQTNRPIAINSVLHVAFDKHTAPELVLVRWVEAGEGSTHFIGCSFVRPLQPHEIEAICGPALSRSAAS
jgi:serine/threonine protein kinase